MDNNAQYFAMPEDFAGAQPSAAPAPLSALQAFLSHLLSSGGAPPMPTRDPGMSASPYPVPDYMKLPPQDPGMTPPQTPMPWQQDAGMTPRRTPFMPPDPGPALSNPSPMAALQQQLTMPPPMQNAPPAGLPVPAPGPASVPDQLPHHAENKLVKILGALAALNGGPGGQVAGAYLQTQHARDVENYNRQQQANATQQGTEQQQFQDTQQQSKSLGGLMDTLEGMDDGSQQKFIEAMTPQQMQAYGVTPDSLKAQFYDKDGKFVPLGTTADAKDAAATLRAQTTAQARLHSLTPAGQQNTHDTMTPEAFAATYGLPYEGFQPAETVRDTTGQTTAQAAQASKLAAAQKGALSTLLTMTPAMQAQVKAGTDAASFAQKYGVPPDAFTPGMTQKDADALAAIAERRAASQLASTTSLTIAGNRNAVTERGQDLSHGDRQASLALRTSEYKSLNAYRMAKLSGTPGGGVGGLKLQQIATDREKARLELQRLRQEGQKVAQSDLTPEEMESQRADIAAQTRQAQGDYNQLDALYQQKMGGGELPPPAGAPMPLGSPPPAPLVGKNINGVPYQGGGRPPIAPNTPTGANRYAPPAGLGALPPMPVYRSNGQVVAGNPGAMPVFTNHAAPRPAAPASGPHILTGTMDGQPFEFHVPRSRAEFAALTPGKQQAYVRFLRQQKATFR